MFEFRRSPSPLTILCLTALLCAVPAAAVTDLPTAPDTTGAHLPVQENPYGSGTTWMIGMTLVEQGDLPAALPYLAQAWRMSPTEAKLGEVYRDVLLELGYGRDALEVSTRVLALKPDDPHTLEQHVVVQATLEMFDEALAGLDELRADSDELFRLDRLKGEILLRARRWPQAQTHFRAMLADDPEDHERLTATLAEILVLQGRQDDAAVVWREALVRHPGSRALRMGQIQFEVGRGDDRAAMTSAAAADSAGITSESRQDMDWVTLTASLISASGRVESAREILLEMSAAGSLDIDATLLLARILDSTRENSRALSLLRDAAERWPGDPRPRVYLAEFLAMGGDLVAAERTIREALAAAPDNLESRFSLMSILSRLHPDAYSEERDAGADSARTELLAMARGIAAGGQDITPASHLMLGATLHGLSHPEEAVGHFEAAAEDPDYNRDALLNLSVVYDDLGRPDQVLEVLERLFEANPDDAVVKNALGYTLADQGVELERAEALIREALLEDPDNPAYLDSLGWALYGRGQDLEAFDLLVQAANALPDDPVILEHLARVLIRLGQTERAQGVAERALLAGGDPAALADILPDPRGQ